MLRPVAGMNPFAIGALAVPPTAWMVRHNRSAAVAAWARPGLGSNDCGNGRLYARTAGDGDQAVVLLHGLVSTGDVFGADFDRLASTRRLVVPDLLGFGRSIDETRATFSAQTHLDALDELADRTGLFERRWTLGAHSMGSALALRWAARHPERVDRVVRWGAPIYPSPAAARARISGSAMTRLFVLDTEWAKRACALSCRHRTIAGWLTAAAEPRLPVHVARSVTQHTWPAYRDALRELIIDIDWRRLLHRLDTNGTRVELVWGSNDKVGDPDHARTMAGSRSVVMIVAGADHHLPMTHSELCRAQLTAR